MDIQSVIATDLNNLSCAYYIPYKISKMEDSSISKIMEIINSDFYVMIALVPKYGLYNLYSYFVNECNSKYGTNHQIVPQDEFNKMTPQDEFNKIISQDKFNKMTPEDEFKKMMPQNESKKMSIFKSIRAYPSMDKQVQEFRIKNFTHHFVMDKIMEKKIMENNVDIINIFMDLTSLMKNINLTLSLEQKLKIFKSLNSLFACELPTQEFDLLVFSIASNTASKCNFDFNDTKNLISVIESETETLLSSGIYNQEFKDIIGGVIAGVINLLKKVYDVKLSSDDFLKKKAPETDDNNLEDLDEDFEIEISDDESYEYDIDEDGDENEEGDEESDQPTE